MKSLTPKAYQLLIFLCIIGNYHWSIAQEMENEEEIDNLLDELYFDESEFVKDILEPLKSKHFVYTNIAYNSNTFFSGRSLAEDQYNITPQISFFHKKGFSISTSGIYYEKLDPNWDVTNVSVGYSNTIGKNKLIHYNSGYTRYFYSDGWDIFVNSVDAGIGIRNKKRSLGFKTAINYLFGKDNSLQWISKIYSNIDLFRNKDYVFSFRPQITLIAAEQTIELRQQSRDSDLFQTTFQDYFGLLNTQFKLPLQLATNAIDLEVAYTLNTPNAVPQESSLDTTGFFSFSLGYLLDF